MSPPLKDTVITPYEEEDVGIVMEDCEGPTSLSSANQYASFRARVYGTAIGVETMNRMSPKRSIRAIHSRVYQGTCSARFLSDRYYKTGV